MRAVHAEGFGQGLIQPLNQHAEPAAHHFALVFQLVGDVFRHVDGDGESEAVEGAAAAVNLRIDGDNFAFTIKERAAGIAGVDRRIGLDERHIIAARQVAGDRADNALRRGVGEAEGRADGQHPVADLYLIRITEFGDGQVFTLDFHQRDVGAFVQADDFGAVFLVVIELHTNLVRPFDNVRIGENVAVAIDDEAGALSFQHTFPGRILLKG